MKNIKIITLTILLMGLTSAFAQQTTTVLQQDETGPIIQQSAPAAIPSDQPEVLTQAEVPITLLQTLQVTVPQDVIMITPVVRDETMPPDKQPGDNLPAESAKSDQQVVMEEFDGPDEAEGPGEVKPIEK